MRLHAARPLTGSNMSLSIQTCSCQGAEECDDFNDYGGDGCSAVCLWEIKEVASWSQTEVMVTIRPLGQLCRTS